MAIVCIQLNEIATDIGLGYPKESKPFPADSGCLLDEVHVGSGSITVNGQITVPRRKKKKVAGEANFLQGGKFPAGSGSCLCPRKAGWPWSTASLHQVPITLYYCYFIPFICLLYIVNFMGQGLFYEWLLLNYCTNIIS